MIGFVLRLVARLPFLFIAGRAYGPDVVGRFAGAVLAVELAALIATLGLKRGLAQMLTDTDRPHAHVAWDGLAMAGVASLLAIAILALFPQVMFPNSGINGLDRLLPFAVLALTWTEIALTALAYRHNVNASVTARAIVEPWTISIAAAVLALDPHWLRDGLIISYALSTLAALIAAMIPFIRSYGWPVGWQPRIAPMMALGRANVPLAGADAIEWATRNVDRFILSLFFSPAIVGIYYMAQQVASLSQKLKTSFDPILGPVITKNLAEGNRAAVARQIGQVGFWILAAQALLALMGGIPAKGVMGVVGPQFVAGYLALACLLLAEVLAVTGSVSEAALVYVARRRNLAISCTVLFVQSALSIGLILAARAWGAPVAVQAAAPAAALAMAVAAGSVAKATLLGHLLGARIRPFRPALMLAVVAGALAGHFATRWAEWAEIVVGIPLIVLSYGFVLWRAGFGPEDRALFQRTDVNAESAASR